MQSVPTSAPCMGPRPAPRSQAVRGAARSPYPGRPRPPKIALDRAARHRTRRRAIAPPCRCMFAKRHREDRIDVSFHGSGSVACEDRDGACPFGGSSTPVTGPAGRWPPSQTRAKSGRYAWLGPLSRGRYSSRASPGSTGADEVDTATPLHLSPASRDKRAEVKVAPRAIIIVQSLLARLGSTDRRAGGSAY